MVKGIAHIALSTHDLEKSLWFYETVLGGQRIIEIDQPQGSLLLVCLRYENGTCVELFAPRKEHPIGKELGRNHACFVVDDIASLVKAFTDNSIEMEGEPLLARDGNLQLWCKDPNGYRVEFMQYHKECPQMKPENFLKIT